jgi:type IV pilus assembly protein PilE
LEFRQLSQTEIYVYIHFNQSRERIMPMPRVNNESGFTLIELMITAALIGIIAAVAFPLYTDYVATARIGVLQTNVQTIRLQQIERRASFGEFVEGTYDAPGGVTTLTTRLGWAPETDQDVITYVVVCDVDGTITGECARTSGYTVTATHPNAASDPVVMSYQP